MGAGIMIHDPLCMYQALRVRESRSKFGMFRISVGNGLIEVS